MRQAGTIATRPEAERFANYLLAQGITSKVEPSDGQWAIWIHDDDAIARSKQELQTFLSAPDDERYRAAEGAARQAKREMAAREKQAKRNYVDMRDQWAKPWRRRPVTIGLIATCVALSFHVFGDVDQYLYFSWKEIGEGQLWRLFTPDLLHMQLSRGPWHLIFNMFWLYDLGTILERHHGSARFALLVLALSLLSNLAQATFDTEYFVGMSGVVYGLFGYMWVRGRLDPACGLFLAPNVVFWMMLWFVLCMTGMLGPIANWGHGGGLAAGAAIAYLVHESRRWRRSFR